MIFEGLATKLQGALARLRGKGKLSEADVAEAAREIRLALLEADVNYKVVKDFVTRLKERAIGQEVLSSLTPGQQVVKIVDEELTALLGGTQARLNLSSRPPTVLMLVGLQGSGKTTQAAKLARHLQRQSRRPLLVAADVYRPAAVRQLQVLGEQLSVPVFTLGTHSAPPDIAAAAVDHARSHDLDQVIIDTAGRLQIDEPLMQELVDVKSRVHPHEILLVVDAMTGQEAVAVAEAFHTRLGVDGVIMSKLDSDSRGGAALSIRAVTGCPIKFAGVGEKLDALEPFFPDRMAQRILGMGDVLTLIERAQESFDAQQALEMQKKLRRDEFTLEDFGQQLKQVKKLGPLEQVLGMIPGLGGRIKELKNLQVEEKDLAHVEAIIGSMTPGERRNPEILNASRRRRIARGSGTRIQDVNRLLKQFEETKRMMRQLGSLEKGMGQGPGKGLRPFH